MVIFNEKDFNLRLEQHDGHTIVFINHRKYIPKKSKFAKNKLKLIYFFITFYVLSMMILEFSVLVYKTKNNYFK